MQTCFRNPAAEHHRFKSQTAGRYTTSSSLEQFHFLVLALSCHTPNRVHVRACVCVCVQSSSREWAEQHWRSWLQDATSEDGYIGDSSSSSRGSPVTDFTGPGVSPPAGGQVNSCSPTVSGEAELQIIDPDLQAMV